MKQKIKPRSTTMLSVALAATLAGLGAARIWYVFDLWLLIPAGVVCLTAYFARGKKSYLFWATLIIFGFLLGGWRGAQYMNKLQVYDDIIGENVVLQVEAIEDAVYSERGQLTFSAVDITLVKPYEQEVVGQVSIEGRGVPMVYRGDVVRAEGKLFRRRGANQAGMNFAVMELVSTSSSPIDKLRREFAAGMQNALPEPLASFGMGLLIGQRTTLDEQITEQLTTTGLIHIVAVSGYNLTIIIGMSQRLLSKRSRYQSLVFSVSLIAVFLLMTGNSPSIVRAAIVSTLGLVAWYFGRKFRPLLLLLIAAVLTAVANPLMLWSNVGWYLSFTAFFGVLILGPLLKARLVKVDQRDKIIPSVLSETVSAQLCTLPIILFIFGRLSIVSIVANLLVVPLVPFAMLASLVAGIGGMIGVAVGSLVGLPARFLLDYMLDIAALLSRVPKASVQFSITLSQMIYLYGLIVFITAILWSKAKPAQIQD